MDKNIKKIRGLKVLKKRHKDIRRLLKDQNYPEIHGDKIWGSSYFIMDLLEENPPARGSRIIDIGCGWGLLAVFCAKKYKASVLAVDADEYVFPFVELHAKENRVKLEQLVSRYQDIPAKRFKNTDLMVGGDICFWEELVDPLHETIARALRQGVETIMIGDPGRSTFLTLAKRCQEDFNAVLIPYVVIDPEAHEGYILLIQNGAARRKNRS